MSVSWDVYDVESGTNAKFIFNCPNSRAAEIGYGLDLEEFSVGGVITAGGALDAERALKRISGWLSLNEDRDPSEGPVNMYLLMRMYELRDALEGSLEDLPERDLKLYWL